MYHLKSAILILLVLFGIAARADRSEVYALPRRGVMLEPSERSKPGEFDLP